MSGTLGGLGRLLARIGRKSRQPPPTVFHLAHPEAGSDWVERVLRALAGERVAHCGCAGAVEPGKIYPALFLTREQFAGLPLPENSRRFVVVRDLRDTLVSAYFAHALGPAEPSEWGRTAHAELNRLSTEDGLFFLLDGWLPAVAEFQWSWAASGEELVRYEDLLADDEMVLARVLLRRCGLEVDPVDFGRVVRTVRFELPGEDVAGDWRNHFTDELARAVRRRHGSLLVATGYEKDERW